MYLFTSENVSPGHPDKCADIISDTIVDTFLAADPNARVAAEVMIAGKEVVIGGEVSSTLKPDHDDYEKLVKKALIDIGYTGTGGFSRTQALHPDDVTVTVRLNAQSPEIASGVKREDGEIGAGDQGIMFGYACDETKELMPSAIVFSRRIRERVYEYALGHPFELGVDIKTQVTVDYGSKEGFDNGEVKRIDTIVVSAPYTESFGRGNAERLIRRLIQESGLPEGLVDGRTRLLINPSGSYVGHSALHDCGLTGRKLIVDTYGGYAPIGGGAQSGKDWTKVDRSGLYAARWLARRIVEEGLAKKALVQLSYAIGEAKPVSVTVDTMGTGRSGGGDEELSGRLAGLYPLTPAWIRDAFGLDRPGEEGFGYADVAARGQVGVGEWPWERLVAADGGL
ncbi:methionine adenosyltransferase [Hydrogenimonas sp. SS33]|uniref:methionine adenosyltransferase n=1 Tax=Hydrogenimonas leucolamina TaxID=2954236 RepID=UPI00336C0171